MHTSTVSPVRSGPSDLAGLKDDFHQLALPELQQKKEVMETQMHTLSAVLDSHGVDMHTSLTSRDGFPRADIDVAQVRMTRAQVARLRNDHKALMSVLEERLHERFASTLTTADVPRTSVDLSPAAEQQRHGTPFATVNSVVPGSPAHVSGLRPGDQIIRINHVSHLNHNGLREVADCVQQHEGQAMTVEISRSAHRDWRQHLRVSLTPTRHWGGRGLLGCHIIPC
ncbi:hypothetical protein SODALDRAFT_332308 [Sodiomyces alkalinus F11]|uniref:Probable 26S proteasome regulatory subunit p27 n=1 Tax=Sodiomyces alkalinus (strain CBS 110278 / VKM F-3762 / F11) TaxID=1314773 RepID=A0A3N2Q053_SODAK|nr:hypothetical protein SODALDRAFT_332308 [Sodiomyces alkalinus F11]ROT40144.1 hypothetical protein SODALDRAFT_332308 [Sodiomyces alkalinus F11]